MRGTQGDMPFLAVGAVSVSRQILTNHPRLARSLLIMILTVLIVVSLAIVIAWDSSADDSNV